VNGGQWPSGDVLTVLPVYYLSGAKTDTVAGMELFRHLTLVVEDGRIKKIFYRVFPPDKSAEEVLAWMREQSRVGRRLKSALEGIPGEPEPSDFRSIRRRLDAVAAA
jgi:hypothetical protein